MLKSVLRCFEEFKRPTVVQWVIKSYLSFVIRVMALNNEYKSACKTYTNIINLVQFEIRSVLQCIPPIQLKQYKDKLLLFVQFIQHRTFC